jgi:hypothetical protein
MELLKLRPLPDECTKCIKQAQEETWQKTPQQAINCIEYGMVPENRQEEVPCTTVSTDIGGAGNFQSQNEVEFNNRNTRFDTFWPFQEPKNKKDITDSYLQAEKKP